MNVDTELEVWRHQWQSGTPVPLDLRRKVQRQSRFMKIGLIVEILVTIVIGGAVAGWAVRSPQPDILLLAIETWVFVAVAWAFGLAVNRGNWSPSAQDTAAFIELSVRRCRARLAGIWFASAAFLFHTAFVLGWVYHYSPTHQMPLLTWLLFGSVPIDVVWLCALAFFCSLFWYRRRKREEMAYLLGLQGKLSARYD